MSLETGPTSPVHSLVVPVVQRDDYQIAYERVQGMTLAHSQVRRWSAAIARRYLADLNAAQALLGEPLYAIQQVGNPTQDKFLRRLGATPCGTVRDHLGRDVLIYERPYHG